MNADPPTKLDGATVLSFTETANDFGSTSTNDRPDVRIAALAIANYDDAPGFYLFACDSDWNVVGDLFYDRVSDAKKDAERFYQTSPLAWINWKKDRDKSTRAGD